MPKRQSGRSMSDKDVKPSNPGFTVIPPDVKAFRARKKALSLGRAMSDKDLKQVRKQLLK